MAKTSSQRAAASADGSAAGPLKPGLLKRLGEIAKAVNGVFGVPDYDRYVREFSARYPDQTPMTREEFEKDRLHDRYIKPGNRCV